MTKSGHFRTFTFRGTTRSARQHEFSPAFRRRERSRKYLRRVATLETRLNSRYATQARKNLIPGLEEPVSELIRQKEERLSQG